MFPDVLLAEITAVAAQLKMLAQAPPLPAPPPCRSIAVDSKDSVQDLSLEASRQLQDLKQEAAALVAQIQNLSDAARVAEERCLQEVPASSESEELLKAERKIAFQAAKAGKMLEAANAALASARSSARKSTEVQAVLRDALASQLASELAAAESAERDAAKAVGFHKMMKDLPELRKRRQAAELLIGLAEAASSDLQRNAEQLRSELHAAQQQTSSRTAPLEERIVQLDRECRALSEQSDRPDHAEAEADPKTAADAAELEASNRQLLIAVREARQARDKATRILSQKMKERDEAEEAFAWISRAHSCKAQDACIIT